MQSVIMLFVSGDMFLFENNNFTDEQKQLLEKLAKEISNLSNLRDLQGKDVCQLFIDESLNKLNLTLKRIKISFVLRINK